MRDDDELISEDTLRTLTAAVLIGVLISDIILIESKSYGTFAIVLPFQLAIMAFHRKRLTEVLKYIANLIIQPYVTMFKMFYKIFTGRTYEGKSFRTQMKAIPVPTKAIDPKVNGRWEVPVNLTPEYEEKLNQYMKHYELDYEPVFEPKKSTKPKIKPAPQAPLPPKDRYPTHNSNYVDSQGNPLRPEVLQALEDFHGITVDNHINHSNFKFNGTTRSTTVTETTQTLKSNNSKIVVDNAKIKGNNNRITGNNNVINGNNLRVKGNNNIINGNNSYVDGKNNIVTGNNATVINRGGSMISSGNNGKVTDF
jgi:hypothetical protein